VDQRTAEYLGYGAFELREGMGLDTVGALYRAGGRYYIETEGFSIVLEGSVSRSPAAAHAAVAGAALAGATTAVWVASGSPVRWLAIAASAVGLATLAAAAYLSREEDLTLRGKGFASRVPGGAELLGYLSPGGG